MYATDISAISTTSFIPPNNNKEYFQNLTNRNVSCHVRLLKYCASYVAGICNTHILPV